MLVCSQKLFLDNVPELLLVLLTEELLSSAEFQKSHVIIHLYF
jgi:hypothetical protein